MDPIGKGFRLGFDYRNTVVENLALKVVAVFKKTWLTSKALEDVTVINIYFTFISKMYYFFFLSTFYLSIATNIFNLFILTIFLY